MNFLTERSYRLAVSALLLLVLANALAAGLRTVSDPDMGWHIATGRYVVQHHRIPSTDILSYTAAGKPWIYPPFGGVLLYLIYKVAGCIGLSCFCALACVGTVAYLVRHRHLSELALAMCAIEPIAFRTGPRADLFNTVFFALFLGELWNFHRGSGDRKYLWLLPVIMLFWVNVHPGFVLGLAVIGAYLLFEACDLPLSERHDEAIERLRQAWPWLVGTFAVTLLNPWGPQLYRASLTLAGLGGQQRAGYNTSAFIGEFLPVPVSSHLLRQLVDLRHPENGYAWLMVIAILVIGLSLWRKQPGVAIVQALALYLSLQHVRYIGLFCIATAIIGATTLNDTFGIDIPPNSHGKSLSSKSQWSSVRADVGLTILLGLCGVALLHTADFVSNRIHVVFQTQSRFGAGEATWFPERAVSFIRREQLPGNIFQEYGLGGFAAWRLGPEYLDFIDGRFDHLAPEVLVMERKLLAQPADPDVWQPATNKWNFNVLLISEAGQRALSRQDALAFCQSLDWRPVYLDEVSLVLIRNVPANRPWIDRLQINCQTEELAAPLSSSRKDLYDFYSNAGGMLFALQRDQESEAALLRAKALYPQDPNVRVTLAQLYERHKMLAKAEAEYRASLALEENDKSWYELGRICAGQHRLAEAEKAFTRAANLSVAPLVPYMALAQVELWLRHPEAALQALESAENSSPYRNGAEDQAARLYAEIADGRSDAHEMMSHAALAIEFEQEAVRLDPSPGRCNKLADLLDTSGEFEASRRTRQRANELDRAEKH